MKNWKYTDSTNQVVSCGNESCSILAVEIQQWLAEGNTPEPVDPPTPQQLLSELEQAITKHMDEVAQAKRYDNRDSCRLYAGYVNPFQAEAIAYGQWVAACWVASNTAQAEIMAGTRTVPTPAEAVAELPLMEWPV